MPQMLLEKNKRLLESAVQVITGSSDPISNTELAEGLIAAGHSDLPLSSTRFFLTRNLPRCPEVTSFLASMTGHGGKAKFWCATEPVSPRQEPLRTHNLASVVVAQAVVDQQCTNHTHNGIACSTFPRKVTHTYWECSDGNEFTGEVDALRHELDVTRGRK